MFSLSACTICKSHCCILVPSATVFAVSLYHLQMSLVAPYTICKCIRHILSSLTWSTFLYRWCCLSAVTNIHVDQHPDLIHCPRHATVWGNKRVDILISRMKVEGKSMMDKGDIVETIYELMLVKDTRTDETKWSKMSELRITCEDIRRCTTIGQLESSPTSCCVCWGRRSIFECFQICHDVGTWDQ